MWIGNRIFREDLDSVAHASFIDWKAFEGKTFFVTGGTGLIGYTFICSLLYRNLIAGSHMRVIALVRDLEKARQQYAEVLVDGEGALSFVEGDLEHMPVVPGKVDYVLHAGGPTASRYFSERPVETIRTITAGTAHVLHLAREKRVAGMVFLSTMEVYGASTEKRRITEDTPSCLDTMVPRNSYPEAKRLCENLCAACHEEYGVPVNVLRLTQTFGPGIRHDDNRVFAQFIRSAMEKKGIVLLTEGTTRRSYLYTADAVTAILSAMAGEPYGAAYNAANESSYCSIYEMARLAAHVLANDAIHVVIRKGSQDDVKSFMPPMLMNLDTARLQNRGGVDTLCQSE